MVTETEINTPQQAENTDTEATIIFVGDMMFDRYIRDTQGSDYTNTLDPELISYLNTADAVIGNLEGPITNFESVTNYHENNPDHYRFTFSPDVIELLKLANFKALLLGNNHIENFGNAGVKQTTDFLELANLKHFGNPTAPSDYATLSFNDLDLALVAHNWFDSIPIEDTINLVSNLNNNHDYIIVMPHWGEEYETIANSKQTQEATLLITAGADLIIGSHPHVVQNNDQVDDTLIYYSLGNFVFDQYFSDFRIDLAIEFIWNKVHELDRYVDHHKVWEQKGEEKEKSLQFLSRGLLEIAVYVSPLLPDTAQKITDQFTGDTVVSGNSLFPRL